MLQRHHAEKHMIYYVQQQQDETADTPSLDRCQQFPTTIHSGHLTQFQSSTATT
jgi:hypothetical protein